MSHVGPTIVWLPGCTELCTCVFILIFISGFIMKHIIMVGHNEVPVKTCINYLC